MIVYSLLAVTLLLACTSLYLLSKENGSSRAAGLALGSFVFLYGTWLYLSVYLQWVFAAAAAATLAWSIARKRPRRFRHRRRRAAGNLLATGLFGTLSVLYFTGTRGQVATVDLAFPLKGGRYIVLQGGKGLPANVFHATGRGAIYALDLAKLNRWGNRASRIFSERLEDYAIFGDTIYAPCSGRVGRAVSDNPDNIPPNRERGPHNLNGVVLEGAACTVFLGHMRQGAVFVDSGDAVTTGQPLGLAGNSGFTLEPHLHLQVHARGTSGAPWYRNPPLYPAFDGKHYLLFQTIDARR